jgi:indole-3-glycerol phosphate synthase
MNELSRIVAATREAVAARRREHPDAAVHAAAANRPDGDRRGFRAALSRDGLSLIAEHKRRSPSAGLIRDGVSLKEVVGAYQRGGASALSILTEGPSFGGSLDDLREARASAGLPILRKDFIVDPYQVAESAAWGADAILLIVAALSEAELENLHELAAAHHLAALVEVHDEHELAVAVRLGAEIIGINNRDLATLEVDTRRTYELLPRVPPGTLVVAESGFRERSELEQLGRAGVDAVLVGEALMRSQDIETACRALTSRGGSFSSTSQDQPH